MALDYLISELFKSDLPEEQQGEEVRRLHQILGPIESVMTALSNHNPNYRFNFNYLKGKYPVDSFHASMTINKMTTGELNTCYRWETPSQEYKWPDQEARFLSMCFEDIINYIAFSEPKWDRQKEYVLGFKDYFR